jgi:hypothetical protein
LVDALQRSDDFPPDTTIFVETVNPTNDLIEEVDDDRLAHALANGMWTRYEWAITELGNNQETIASLREAVRVRDETIQRLRGYMAQHLATRDVKDIARELLTEDTGRG